MVKHSGWVKLPRSLLVEDVAATDELLGLYVRILAAVNYKPGRFKSTKLSTFVDVKPGQLVFGWRTIGKALYKRKKHRPSHNTIRRRILALQGIGVVTVETHSSKQFSILTINETRVPNSGTRSGTGSGTGSGTDIRRKKEGSKKRKFKPPSLQEIETYCQSRQSSVDPKRFWEYFDAGGWQDSRGNQVKNWKQKLITWESNSKQNETTESPSLLPLI